MDGVDRNPAADGCFARRRQGRLSVTSTRANLLSESHSFNWPVSQWATCIKICLHASGYAQIGVYDVRHLDTDAEHALAPAFFLGFDRCSPLIEVPGSPTAALPGSYKFGGWIDKAAATDVVDHPGTVVATNPDVPVKNVDGRFGAL